MGGGLGGPAVTTVGFHPPRPGSIPGWRIFRNAVPSQPMVIQVLREALLGIEIGTDSW